MLNNTTITGNQEIDAIVGVLQAHGFIIPNWMILILLISIYIAHASSVKTTILP